MCFQPGEGPRRGLLHDCENFAYGSFAALACTYTHQLAHRHLAPPHDPPCAQTTTLTCFYTQSSIQSKNYAKRNWSLDSNFPSKKVCVNTIVECLSPTNIFGRKGENWVFNYNFNGVFCQKVNSTEQLISKLQKIKFKSLVVAGCTAERPCFCECSVDV